MTQPSERFGPQSALVERFFSRLEAMRFEELKEVVDCWRSVVGEEWHRAEDALAQAISRAGRHDEQWRIQEQVFELFRNGPWFKASYPGSLISATEASAQYLVSTALFALLVADELRPSEVAVLYAPFAGVIPPEALGLGEGAFAKLESTGDVERKRRPVHRIRDGSS